MTWIGTSQELDALIHAASPTRLFIDTEYDNQRRFEAHLALVQVAWDGGSALVDPFEVPLAALSGWSGEWLSHDGTHDWWLLQQSGCPPPSRCLDTQIAARLLGYERVGLAAVCESILGVELDKSQQRSDWLRRPLNADQRAYAMGDVVYLQQATAQLERELAERHLTEAWYEESAVVLARALGLGDRAPKPFHRLKNLRKNTPQVYGRAQVILEWRFAEAKARNIPEFRVMNDAVVLKLAQGKWVPREAALKQALKGSKPLEWPRRERLSDASKALEKRIKAWRQEKAEALSMEASMVLPPAPITLLATGVPVAEIEALQGWRRTLFVTELELLLS